MMTDISKSCILVSLRNTRNCQRFENLAMLFAVLVVLKMHYYAAGAQIPYRSTNTCVYYDPYECNKDPLHCNDTEQCQKPDDGKRSHCYALWTNNSFGVVTIIKKGCWLNHPPCYDQLSCVEVENTKGNQFCCCDGDFCNKEVIGVQPDPNKPLYTTSGTPKAKAVEGSSVNVIAKTLLYSIVPLVLITAFVIIVFYMWRRRVKMASIGTPIPSRDPLLKYPPPPKHLAIERIEVKARGRFGCVWKARMADRLVAVKVFPYHENKSWQTEQDFYNLPHVVNEPNILLFIAAETHTNELEELWLITDYYECGSLHDYLKCNSVTLHDLFTIVKSMTRGLAFLHSIIPATNTTQEKPLVAHRDIKSRNMLLKNDMTVCIADFGLALILRQNLGDVHGQVGTRRYMAPEVLDGSINFSIEYFLKIDIYAYALVLWEVLSRCSTINESLGEYKMPFEEEVGPQPKLEDMQEAVLNKKLRPQLKFSWLDHKDVGQLCLTIEEAWDQDPEARVSAECIEQRMQQLYSRYVMESSSSTSSSSSASMSNLLICNGDVNVV